MAATTVCEYVGTPDTFAADSVSASSNQGHFYPCNAVPTTLFGALAAGYVVGSCAPFVADPVFTGTASGVSVSSSMAVPRLVWTLYTAGVV